MDFERSKKAVLGRRDRSRKGSIDARVAGLVRKINSLGNFYTTSSCAGRIMVYAKRSEKKYDTDWLYVSHEPAKFSAMSKALESLPQCPVWFREEPMILHVCARSIADGQGILDLARECGFKRSGIMATGKRVMVEFTGTEIMDTIIAERGKLVVPLGYVKKLVAEANRKLKRNFGKIKLLEGKIDNEL
jgi:tRNA wybutosine-synthesizing protein 3